MTCEKMDRLLVLYAADELEPAERAAVEEHLKDCARCAATAEQERVWLARLTSHPPVEPPASLLEQCRTELAEALDEAADSTARQGAGGRLRGWLESFRPARWLALHPGWGTAFLLLLGITLGYGLPRWLATGTSTAAEPVMSIAPALTEAQLENVAVSGINFVPASNGGTPGVELHLMSQNPIVLQGTVNDSQVRRVLIHVVENTQMFDSGLRLDSLDALRTRTDDAQIRRVLCHAARHDRNPAVRLKALEALRGLEGDAQVRQTLLDALLNDDNPGVRVEAINALRAMVERGAAEPDAHLVEVLRDRIERDPSTYIRMQSAAAMREIGPREIY